MEDHAQDKPNIASNTDIFSIMLLCCCFIGKSSEEVSPIVSFHGHNHSLVHGLYNNYENRGQRLYKDEAIIGTQHSLSWMKRGIV
jgi:hypothetical protein